ncbi:hypothetical protein MN608_07773 [Microdochium nivale]|nr:hypothetical protein MN608_07773 [Microdochium nivale]
MRRLVSINVWFVLAPTSPISGVGCSISVIFNHKARHLRRLPKRNTWDGRRASSTYLSTAMTAGDVIRLDIAFNHALLFLSCRVDLPESYALIAMTRLTEMRAESSWMSFYSCHA